MLTGHGCRRVDSTLYGSPRLPLNVAPRAPQGKTGTITGAGDRRLFTQQVARTPRWLVQICRRRRVHWAREWRTLKSMLGDDSAKPQLPSDRRGTPAGIGHTQLRTQPRKTEGVGAIHLAHSARKGRRLCLRGALHQVLCGRRATEGSSSIRRCRAVRPDTIQQCTFAG